MSLLPFLANQIKPLTVIPVLFIYHPRRPPTTHDPLSSTNTFTLGGDFTVRRPPRSSSGMGLCRFMLLPGWQGKPVIRGPGVLPPAGSLWKFHSNKRTGTHPRLPTLYATVVGQTTKLYVAVDGPGGICKGTTSTEESLNKNMISKCINWRVSVVVPRCFPLFHLITNEGRGCLAEKRVGL